MGRRAGARSAGKLGAQLTAAGQVAGLVWATGPGAAARGAGATAGWTAGRDSSFLVLAAARRNERKSEEKGRRGKKAMITNFQRIVCGDEIRRNSGKRERYSRRCGRVPAPCPQPAALPLAPPYRPRLLRLREGGGEAAGEGKKKRKGRKKKKSKKQPATTKNLKRIKRKRKARIGETEPRPPPGRGVKRLQ